MFCEKCGNQLNNEAVFCPKCGNRVGNETMTNPPIKSQKSTKRTIIVVFGAIALLLVIGILVLFRLFLNKPDEAVAEILLEEDEITLRYKQYLGAWKCVGDIGHPDGMLDRVGSYIFFTEDGIDSSDALGSNRQWYALDDMQYYNTDGDDYFVYVDGVYDIGFKFVSEENQIVIYTPSSNYPSTNPYNWNDRIRFERDSE